MNNFDKTYNKLFEAMSRRDFLRPGKKSKNPPETPKELEASKAPVKKPKAISRRDFIKKTGGGGILSALTPVDKMLQSWPDIISQVASIANWKSLFNTNLLKYQDSIVTPLNQRDFKISDKIIQSIIHLVPNDPTYKPKLHQFSIHDKAAEFLNKLYNNTINPTELKMFDTILKQYNMDINYLRMPGVAFNFDMRSYMSFKDVLDIGVKYNLIDNKTLLELSRRSPGVYDSIESAIDKKGIRKELEHIDDEKNNKKEETIDNKQNSKEKDKQKNKNNKNKRKDTIEYSRMDKAGGSEDVQGVDYTTLENMKNYDKLVSKILSEVVGPNAPGGDSLPTPNKDYKWPSGEITPEMLQDLDKKANTPKAIKDIVVGFLLELDGHLEDDYKYWFPFIEKLLKENKSDSLTDLLESATLQRLKSLANILLLAGKSVFIKLGREKDAQTTAQLHNVIMKLFK